MLDHLEMARETCRVWDKMVGSLTSHPKPKLNDVGVASVTASPAVELAICAHKLGGLERAAEGISASALARSAGSFNSTARRKSP